MANEYLKRIPTSTGNRKTWTVSFWHKRNATSGYNNFYTTQGSSPYLSVGNFNADGTIQICRNESATVTQVNTTSVFKDISSWMHIMVSWDTTSSTSSDRAKLYVNGVLQPATGTYPSINYEGGVNRNVTHTIGTVLIGGAPYTPAEPKGEWTDYFFVDGQALTPDVFGYYKKGDGYISAGTAQATDFKRGQWVPKAPKIIRSIINARGGFGVNGFYLPMNDASNFGADFHCEPNSIIKLKGEDFDAYPQPRNGAPETTDGYVSQLRDDPFKDYLVLAVPGNKINLVTNGDFSQGTTGWTAYNSVISSTNGLQLEVNDSAAAGSWSAAVQEISTVIGQSYTLSLYVGTGSDSRIVGIYNGAYPAAGTAPSTTVGTYNSAQTVTHTFTATASTTSIMLVMNNEGIGYFDDVILYSNTPRDYSANIKGSGTNKIILHSGSGTSGVGYEIPSYYGSAINMDPGTSDGLLLGWGEGDQDYNFGTGDFTMEAWVYTNSTPSGYWSIFRSKNYNDSVASPEGGISFYGYQGGLRIWDRDGDTSDLYASNIGSIPNQQWTHVAVVRHNGRLLTFCNGVCVGNIANVANYTNNGFEIGQNFPWDGYIKDARIYKGVAKYTGGFDVPKPYTPVGIESWRSVPDTTANNFATLNSVEVIGSTGSGINKVLSNGNLTATTNGNSTVAARGNFPVSSGKWYFEATNKSALGNTFQNDGIGVVAPGAAGVNGTTLGGYAIVYRDAGGAFLGNENSRSDPAAGTHATYVAGDIIGVALDIDNRDVEFFKNGVSVATYSFPSHIGTDDEWVSETMLRQADALIHHNFGQNPTFSGNTTAGTYTDSNGKGLFKYQPPSGFLALCEDNLPTPAIKNPGEHFKTVLWTGDGNSGRSITGVGFKPDLVWVKERSNTSPHELIDSVRGAGYYINSNTTNSELFSDQMVTSFDNNGFGIGNAGSHNQNGETYVAWCWRAGAGTTSINTDGSIPSVVSVNQDAGFSIATWTGNGQNSQTIGHGLGKSPDFYIWKSRDNAREWHIAHKSLTAYNYTLYFTSPGELNNNKIYQAPDSSVIYSENSNTIIGLNEDYVGYFWAEIEGFSKFGSYVGNESADGPFVYCGFKPAFVMIKASSTSGDWLIMDSSRDSTNPNSLDIYANLSNVETNFDRLDFLSNGFKNRSTYSNNNANGVTYIFAAFAESPFSTANAK